MLRFFNISIYIEIQSAIPEFRAFKTRPNFSNKRTLSVPSLEAYILSKIKIKLFIFTSRFYAICRNVYI